MNFRLVLNLCNQILFNYTYIFTKSDLFFIAEYDINVMNLLDKFMDDILKQKAYT